MIRGFLALAGCLIVLAAACDGGSSDSADPSVTASTTTSSGCSPSRPHEPGDTSLTFEGTDGARSYILHVPTGYDGEMAAPLVVAFHGLGHTPEIMREVSHLNTVADERGFIVVYPAGTGQIPAWNISEVPAGPDESAFIGALVDELESTLCVDERHIFATGYSNGGAMAQKLACDLPDRLAAVAPVAATYLSCSPPVPVVAFHGTADMSAPFEGGQTATGVVLPPVRRALSEWGRALGCDGLPLISRQGTEIEISTYVNCPAGDGEALLYTVLGGGHTWPGSPVTLDPAITGPTTQAIDASAVMLDFFLEHALTR